MKVEINGIELGEATIVSEPITHIDDSDFYPLKRPMYDRGEYTVRINIPAMRKIIHTLFPGSLMDKGYYIVNRRGRNVLKDLRQWNR